MPLKSYKSSWSAQDAQLTQWLAKFTMPAHFMNQSSGFTAGLLVHAEMYGLSATNIVAIADSHYLSSESLQGYAPIFNNLLNLSKDYNLQDIATFTHFKAIIKESN